MKTDIQLQQDVTAELRWKPNINSALIGVEVKDDIVTLTGQVGSYAEKEQVERMVQNVAGVKALTVDLDVRLPHGFERNDADIARAAEIALDWLTTLLPKDAIQVLVEKGWVTLSGEVEWDYQRQAAHNAIQYVIGINGISNKIIIKPTVALVTVKHEIEAALNRMAVLDARNIIVDVKGHEITLSGKAQSWSERSLVVHSAWCVPGVQNVINNILITKH